MKKLLNYLWTLTFKKMSNENYFYPKDINYKYESEKFISHIWYSVYYNAKLSVCTVFCVSVMSTYFSLSLSTYIGELSNTNDKEIIITSLLSIASVWVLIPILRMVNFGFELISTQNIRIGVTKYYSFHALHSNIAIDNNFNVGKVVDRIETIGESTTSFVHSLCDTIIKICAIIVICVVNFSLIDIKLGVLTAIWLLFSTSFSCYLAYTGINLIEQASDYHAKLISKLTESLSSLNHVIRNSLQLKSIARLDKYLKKDLKSCREVRSYWLLVQVIEGINKILFGVSIGFVIFNLYLNNLISTQELVTAISLLILLSFHYESVAFNFVELFHSAGEVRSSLNYLNALKSIDDNKSKSDIDYKRVELVLFNSEIFPLEPNDRIAIIGNSGSGKSTFFNNLLGLTNVSSVTVDGNPTNIRSCASYLGSNPYLLEGSLEENLGSSLDNLLILNNELFSLMATLGIKNNTSISEDAKNISLGQRQVLGLAREIIKGSKFLLLDEAFSNLDKNTKALIHEKILPNYEGTIISIIHDTSLIKYYRKTIDFNDPIPLFKSVV